MGRGGFSSTREYGTLGALIASLVLLVLDLRKRKVKLLDATVLCFAVVTIAGTTTCSCDAVLEQQTV